MVPKLCSYMFRSDINIFLFPVDCAMGGWSDWSGCSQTCGDGIATRSREVVEQPLNGGLACSDRNESRNCKIEPCAGKCE